MTEMQKMIEYILSDGKPLKLHAKNIGVTSDCVTKWRKLHREPRGQSIAKIKKYYNELKKKRDANDIHT